MTEARAELVMSMQQQSTVDSSYLKLQSHPDYILPQKVLLFSALIPGSGEMVCGSYLRGLIFLGVEIGAWSMYSYYNKLGDEKDAEFMDFADQYWNKDKYTTWRDNYAQDQEFSHELPETKTQQYYEMIGKYDQFLVGWEEVPDNLNLSKEEDPNSIYFYTHQPREEYMDMRYDANKLFKLATNGAYIAMFNHILSAIDAAWLAKQHNKKLVTTSLKLENKIINYQPQTMLTLNLSW
jgi:hypothetical protein